MPEKLIETRTTNLSERPTHREVALREENSGPGKPKKSFAGKVVLLLAIVACVVALVIWRSSTRKTQAASAAQADAATRRAVPVVVSAAEKRDMPVYLEGLGGVQAYYTVTVKSRVDGELTEVPVKEGQEVKKGDLIAVIDPRPYQVALSQAQATLARDQAQLSDAKLDAGRYSQLVKEGVIAQQQYDTQNALAGQVQGSVSADQAAIDNAKLNLVYSHITSPINGRVGLRLVDPGNIVHASDAGGLLIITQMQPISVVFTLPEDSLPSVNAAMRKGTLQVVALTRDDSMKLATGKLETINNQIDPTTGTYQLKAVFDNADRALWPNQFVNARLLLDVKKDAILIPAAAVQHGAQGAFVYVVGSDKTAQVRNVTVGITEGTTTEITGGLSQGDVVVTDGQDKLRGGVAVDARSNNPGRGNVQPGAPPNGPGNGSRKGTGPGGPSSTPFLGNNPTGGGREKSSGAQGGAGNGQPNGGHHRRQPSSDATPPVPQ